MSIPVLTPFNLFSSCTLTLISSIVDISAKLAVMKTLPSLKFVILISAPLKSASSVTVTRPSSSATKMLRLVLASKFKSAVLTLISSRMLISSFVAVTLWILSKLLTVGKSGMRLSSSADAVIVIPEIIGG